MSNSGKIWDTREAYKQIRNNTWSRGAGRAFGLGGNAPSATNVIDVVTLSTTGNATDYGDLEDNATSTPGCASSTTRGVCMGGENGPSYTNKIQYFNFSSTGNAADFGDMTITGGLGASHSNNTRGLAGGFYTPAVSSPYISPTIDVISMASLGNATDFGDLGASVIGSAGYGNNTKAFFAAGSTNGSWTGYTDRIDTVTIATTGNATDYADLSQAGNQGAGFGSTTSGLYVGGKNPSESVTTQMQVNNLANGATGTDFGDLTLARRQGTGADNSVRGVMMGGTNPSKQNTIDYVTIATTGNATDFGDLTVARDGLGSADDSNAGLDFSQTQRPSVTYMPGSGRGFTNAGTNSGGSGGSISRIQMILVPTLGNALDFGDLTAARQLAAATNSVTRSCVAGGETPSAKTNTIDSYEMQSLGNASDFGDLTVTRRNFNNGGTNGSRGTFHGGNTPSVSDVIDYITIASVGNATDFGNLTVARDGSATFSSPTRTVSGGGYAGGELNVIDYITTASTGNATDFGDLTTARYLAGPVSSTIRGVWIAGYAPGRSDVMDYVTIASTGNALDFGDLAQARAAGAGISNNIRGVYAGGEVPGTDTTQIEFITIATTGNSSDFGDLVEACQYVSGTCDANSGLQSS